MTVIIARPAVQASGDSHLPVLLSAVAGKVPIQGAAPDGALGSDLARRQLTLLEHRERGSRRALGDLRRAGAGSSAAA